MADHWFTYLVRVQPHHTDYGGVVWHGTYIQWMESARVECLRGMGINIEELVSLGYDLPVVELSARYHRPLTLGMSASVKTRLTSIKGVRLNWLYEIEAEQGQLCLTGHVSLAPVDVAKQRIVRRLPNHLAATFDKIETYFRTGV
ncbi:MAG: thioesterase family protein [Cyanobacteria bacterium P01_G01_bin.38]